MGPVLVRNNSSLSAKIYAIPSQLQQAYHIVVYERRIPGRVFRVYHRFLESIGVHKKEIVTKNGLRLEAFTNSIWMYHEVWDKDTYGIAGLKLSSGMTVVDIGANQGFYSLYAASKGVRVLAFEPSKAAFDILSRNVARNNMGNLIKCFNMAVTAERGTAQFYEGFDKNGQLLSNSSSVVSENRGGASVVATSTKTISLDDIFRDNNIESCDLVKMDCEGAEYQILTAATRYSFDRIKYVSLEFHEGQVDRLHNLLENGGFEILSTEGSVSGIIKAKRKPN
jgi:FkbM family methyltransferase